MQKKKQQILKEACLFIQTLLFCNDTELKETINLKKKTEKDCQFP